VGIAQAALDAAVGYARERRAFDQPIGAFQGIQFMLADMAIAVHASRLVVPSRRRAHRPRRARRGARGVDRQVPGLGPPP
jgi:alkylation response protein AidB-like acyl-CoA dehydrogenase